MEHRLKSLFFCFVCLLFRVEAELRTGEVLEKTGEAQEVQGTS